MADTREQRRAPLGTTGATLAPAAGPTGGYRRLAAAPGEPHAVRGELVDGDGSAATAAATAAAAGNALLRLVHVTDFQLADPASPGRVDFVQRFVADPAWAGMFPAYRPQELVSPHAFEAMARTVAALVARGAEAGEPVDLVLTTGDNTDSAQRDELMAYLALMDGDDEIDPAFGCADPGAIPARTVSGDYYNPEPESRDHYKRALGFPDMPGLLAAAGAPIATRGFGAPWLACFGNHDCLAQGRTPAGPAFQALVTGGRRPVAAPVLTPGTPSAAYLADPTVLSGGAWVPVEPREDRHIVSKGEYIRAHLDSLGRPGGHGFTEANLVEGTAYYCHDDVPGVRLIVLDTTNPAGHVTGSIGHRQRDWLVARLAEVHARHLDEGGAEVATGNTDRVVVIASHHGPFMMDNDVRRPDEASLPDADLPRYLADDLVALLHRFGNVVLWLAGHEHRNSVTAWPSPRGGGFWHVITSGLCEWPSQTRLVELLPAEPLPVDGSDPGGLSGRLVIRGTMIDHDAPVSPRAPWDLWSMASAHRELALNEPVRVGGPESAGTPQDRNVDLVVPISASLADALAALRASDTAE